MQRCSLVSVLRFLVAKYLLETEAFLALCAGSSGDHFGEPHGLGGGTLLWLMAVIGDTAHGVLVVPS